MAIQCCKSVQRKAFRKYQLKVKSKLAKMSNADRQLLEFWSMVKEINGLDKAKGSAAPDVDDLADHFLRKCRLEKGVMIMISLQLMTTN